MTSPVVSASPGPSVALTIRFFPQTRGVQVEFPNDDKALCLELLCIGLKALFSAEPKKRSGLIIPQLVPPRL